MRRVVGLLLAAGGAGTVLAACAPAAERPAPAPSRAVEVQRAAAPSTVPPSVASTSTQPVPTRRAAPKNFCARNRAPQKVIVKVRAQHAWMCAGRRAVYDTPVTTGIPGEWTSTPTGNYVIQGRNRNAVLTLNTGAQYAVRYWIPFDAPLFGFHDSSWQRFPYGSARYKTQGSHGCIHMPLAAMRFLYRWAARPTAVHIT
jgi:lipoprotein-anchoring transpeptidase ErfK/SrfK